MALAALNDVEDAIEATKRLLTPFDRVTWLRLAVVMFFVGAAGFSFPGAPTTSFDAGPDVDGPTTGDSPGEITPELTPELITLIVGVVAVLLLLFLLYSVIGATMEFVFVDALGREDVRLRRGVREFWRRGLRLFAFRFAVWVLSGGATVGLLLGAGYSLGGWPPTNWADGTVVAVILLAIPVFLLFAVVVGTLLGFTTVFVVPVMLREDRGVLSAWRRFWPTLVGEWKEYVAYLIIAFLLGIAVSMAVGFLMLLLIVALAVPFLVVGAPLVFVLGLSGAGGLVAVLLVFVYALVVFVGALLVQVPFQTFTRYYALFVLGDTNVDFDVIPEPRAAVRTDGGDATDDGEGEFGGPDDGGPDDGGSGGGPGGNDGHGGSNGVGGSGAGTDRTDDGVDTDWNVDRDDRGRRTDDDRS